MMQRAMCLPLGLGARGPEETIRFDGKVYRCVPFRIEVPGLQMWNNDAIFEGPEGQSQPPRLPFTTNIVGPGYGGYGATQDSEPLDVTTRFNEGHSRTVMVWVEHPVFRAMRDLVTPAEAQSALDILSATSDEVAGWNLPWAGTEELNALTNALTIEAWDVVNDRALDRVCRFIRGAGRLHNAHGSVYRIVYHWRWTIAAEICEVLGRPDHEIHRLVYSQAEC